MNIPTLRIMTQKSVKSRLNRYQKANVHAKNENIIFLSTATSTKCFSNKICFPQKGETTLETTKPRLEDNLCTNS